MNPPDTSRTLYGRYRLKRFRYSWPCRGNLDPANIWLERKGLFRRACNPVGQRTLTRIEARRMPSKSTTQRAKSG